MGRFLSDIVAREEAGLGAILKNKISHCNLT